MELWIWILWILWIKKNIIINHGLVSNQLSTINPIIVPTKTAATSSVPNLRANPIEDEVYTKLFNGGNAKLELVDSDDPLEAGLEMLVSPPGKRLQSITLLSGGEQALTALSLIFAVFLTSPAPICILDEVDAPLDDANVIRFCALLNELTRR